MTVNFPSSPSQGDTYTYEAITYTYDGEKWVGSTASSFNDVTISGASANVILQGNDSITTDQTFTFNDQGGKLVPYQQGTWTPAPTQGSATILAASWTRIGNQVTVHFNLQAFTDTSSAVEIEIGGLPYNRNSQFTIGTCRTAYLNYGENRTIASSIMTSSLIRITSSIPSVGATPAGPIAYAEYTNFITANQSQNQVVSSLIYLTDDTTWTPLNGATVS